jgi:hypothetical protein
MKKVITLSDLNSGQKKAIQVGREWWKSDEQCLVISGKPGTGKTSIAEFIVNELDDIDALYCAPTHEAVGQLSDRIGENTICETAHRALGLKANKNFKELVFETTGLPRAYQDKNCLIMDEASMAGDELTQEGQGLLRHATDLFEKIIFLADWAQLPPIGAESGDSPVFTKGYRMEELTQVERHEGDILVFVNLVRDMILSRVKSCPKAFGEIREIKAKQGLVPEFPSDIKRAIMEGRGRVITWTNGKTTKSIVPGVREYNSYFRTQKFGELAALQNPFLETEIIVFSTHSYLLDNDSELHENVRDVDFDAKLLKRQATSNARGQVKQVSKATVLRIECWKLEVSMLKGGECTIYVPTKSGELKYKETLDKFNAMAEAFVGAERAKVYNLKHTFSQMFTFATPSYGQTGQKAQGASIEVVCVDVRNILQMRPDQWKVAFKLLNVACSRATQQLVLIKGERW